MSGPAKLSLGQMAAMACMLEVCAPKPGNVHRGADFADVTLQDFLASAVAIQPVFDQAPHLPLGDLILQAVETTGRVTATNTNLGMILLLAPLSKAEAGEALCQSAGRVVEDSTAADAASIYQAIRLANPGGMGTASAHDLAREAPPHILEAMRHAAGRDRIARQYGEGFRDIVETVLPLLTDTALENLPLSCRIVHTHVSLMAAFPDTLIARKCGQETSHQSAALAQRVLDAGEPFSEGYLQQLSHLDFWLRCDGHRRNPGTTADLITAGLFVGLRQKKIVAPFT